MALVLVNIGAPNDTIDVDTLWAGFGKVNTNFSELGSNTAGQGASLIKIEAGTIGATTTVQEALASLNGATGADTIEGVVSPFNYTVPARKGQQYLDTVTGTWYISSNTTSDSWVVDAELVIYPDNVGQNFTYDPVTEVPLTAYCTYNGVTYTQAFTYTGDNLTRITVDNDTLGNEWQRDYTYDPVTNALTGDTGWNRIS